MSKAFSTDLEISRAAMLQPIAEPAAMLGIPPEALVLYGPYKAKISEEFIEQGKTNPDGKLVLVTAVSPTPAGEGKTTVSVGLGDALNRIGKKTAICLREPSLGPCFGMKGGATGGGYAQVAPMEDINLHFNGDLHAISSANNLLAAMVDNHLHWGNEKNLDPRRITWRRTVDMNDRALRDFVGSLGGVSNGVPREGGFDITAASEVMAVFCLAENRADLERRLGNMVVGYTWDRKPVSAKEMEAVGAMSVLLKDALMPNLVQTLENNPVFIHGGPFANIAHGCNTIISTKAALKTADIVVTEAGFGADLGAEKFFNIKSRKAGLNPEAVVVVATIRALKMHGGVPQKDLENENTEALRLGSANLKRHVENVSKFGVPVLVAINKFFSDTENEIQLLKEIVEELGIQGILCTHWGQGSQGAVELAEAVAEMLATGNSQFTQLYPDEMPLEEKMRTVATSLYGAKDISAEPPVLAQINKLQNAGFGHFPVCMAKTQYSFSTNPKLLGAPEGHIVPIREVRLAAGAEFVVAICGQVMTMPGLPRKPAAEKIHLSPQGEIEGLF